MGEQGRPTDYKPEYNDQAYKLCLLGYTDIELANFFNVCEATINNWKLNKDGFLESLKKGKEIADSEIAYSLHNRAKGMYIKEVKTSDNGEIIETVKEIPPDPTSMIFWLKNRQPEKFRDKKHVEMDFETDKSILDTLIPKGE